MDRKLAGMDIALGATHGVLPQAFYYFGSGQSFGWLPFVILAFVILRIFVGSSRSRARRRERERARDRNPQPLPGQPLPGQPPFGQQVPDFSQFDANYQPPPADFQPGTNPEEPGPASPAEDSGGSFARQRMAAEQSLKRRLDELDQLRRSGRISAEDYTAAREQIFRSS